jgi:hypothetical protein
MTGGQAVAWNALQAGTTIAVTSTGSTVTLDTTNSGGTQTLRANDNVAFDQLTTTGIGGDAGNVDVNAGLGAITGGSINANGSASLVAATNNTGHDLTAATGGAYLQGQYVHWDNLQVAGALGITATAGSIVLGTATSGGTQTLQAAGNIVFNQLTTTGIPGDPGNINLTSTFGSILGGSIFANGNSQIASDGSITLDQMRGSTIKLSSPDDLTIGFVSVVKELDLAANTINVTGTQLPSVPPIPLIMNITGYRGGVAALANVVIDPSAIIVEELSVANMTFVALTPLIEIINGYVSDQMMLTTSNQQILVNNVSPAPSAWPTLQLYQPGGYFTLTQNGDAALTNTYVVAFTGDVASTVNDFSALHACCADFTGASFVNNVPASMDGSDVYNSWYAQKSGVETFYLNGLPAGSQLDARQVPKAVQNTGNSPAVNIDGLQQMKKIPGRDKSTRLLHRHDRYGKSAGGTGQVAAAN